MGYIRRPRSRRPGNWQELATPWPFGRSGPPLAGTARDVFELRRNHVSEMSRPAPPQRILFGSKSIK